MTSDDVYFSGLVVTFRLLLRAFQEEGLVRAIGMRGPHRFATERHLAASEERSDKITQFQRAFDEINPDILAMRDNVLTPQNYTDGVYSLARKHHLGVLINKPLGQGLLTGAYSTTRVREFGPGDHRLRKRWFTGHAIQIIEEGLNEVRQRIAPSNCAIISLMLWACLDRYEHAAVLAGFTSRDQVAMNFRCLGEKPSWQLLALTREIMSRVQLRLDASGEVFLTEKERGSECDWD